MIKFKFNQWKVTCPLTWRPGAAGLSNLPSITLKINKNTQTLRSFLINYCQSVASFCFCKSPKHSLKVAHISILTLKPFGPGRPICPAGPLPPVEPAGPGLPSSPAKPWKDQKQNEWHNSYLVIPIKRNPWWVMRLKFFAYHWSQLPFCSLGTN